MTEFVTGRVATAIGEGTICAAEPASGTVLLVSRQAVAASTGPHPVSAAAVEVSKAFITKKPTRTNVPSRTARQTTARHIARRDRDEWRTLTGAPCSPVDLRHG
ncbi:hypothetical protein [Amycolatopsis sp. NPDC059021]|uniref:hypothetical protein n=1 Tax=Amycolatopsis sp. NPDC059021 TaxID=3346704 RepID=UPI00366B92C3